MYLFVIISFLVVLSNVISLRIATYNIWNVMFNWEVRKMRISQLIKEADPDIIGLQEVRSDAGNTINQMQELQILLPQYAWSAYHPVQEVHFVKDTYKTMWSREGIGVLSRHPITSSHVQNLTYHRGPDSNKRVVLHTILMVADKQIRTALVHFSYDRRQQCSNALELATCIKANKWEDVILLGDFNAYNDFDDPVKMLTGKENDCTKFEDVLQNVDAWPDVYPNDNGYTFSNMPHPGLESRPDRVLVPSSFPLLSASLLGDGQLYKQRYSYHIAWQRLSNIVSAARDTKRGLEGRSCPYDCGPHASCRCGVCVSGGDDKVCLLPNCDECSRHLMTHIHLTSLIFIALIGLTIYAILKVMHAMNRRGNVDLPKQLCCLLNPLLYTQFDRGKPYCFCKLPPMVLVIVAVLGLCLFFQVVSFAFKDVFDDVYGIIEEEYFPSDHRMLVVEIKVH